jgi:pre-mRNA-splicing helicase BRR2
LKKKDIKWECYYNLSQTELGELIHVPKLGKNLYRIIHIFPKLEITAHILPITRNIIQLNLVLTPDFHWDERIHNFVEPFWVTVEDTTSEKILNHEYFTLSSNTINK